MWRVGEMGRQGAEARLTQYDFPRAAPQDFFCGAPSSRAPRPGPLPGAHVQFALPHTSLNNPQTLLNKP